MTDSETEIRYDPAAKPGVSNLLEIMALFSERPIADVEADLAGAGYAALKEASAEMTIAGLAPIQERYHGLSDAEVDGALGSGTERARAAAAETMAIVSAAVGLSD